MSEPKLAAGVEASAFLHRANSLGGFGTVLHKGDAERGTLLLVVTERGQHRALLGRQLDGAGTYRWTEVGPPAAESPEAAQYVARTRHGDPDCWILELDIPFAERFIAETISDG